MKAKQAHSTTSDAEQTLQDLIDSFETAMLVTRTREGELRARPMIIADRERTATLYFASRAEDPKLDEILRDGGVAVTMQDSGRYLSISGEARIDSNQSLIESAWSLSWRAWFPRGSDDPQLDLRVIGSQ